MKRSELIRPYQQSAIDFNSPEALVAVGENDRPYPRYLPIPFHAISQSQDTWTMDAYRRNLTIFPEVYFVIGRDIAMDEENIGPDAILGYGIGLCMLDDAAQQVSKGGTPRDLTLCHWYSQYADDSQFLFDELRPITSAKGLTIEIESPTLGARAFDQSKLKWDGLGLLNAMSPLNSARKYDIVILGAADAPIEVPFEKKFAADEVITVRAGEFGEFRVKVCDLRSESVSVPKWTARPFVVDPAYLDVN